MKYTTKHSSPMPLLTQDDIIGLVGAVDDSIISAILATGASYTEIEQAVRWLRADAEGLRPSAHWLTPAAELVCDMLVTTGALVDQESSGQPAG